MNTEQLVREALRVAHDHIDMHSLEVSHCKDAALIRAALAQPAEGGEVELTDDELDQIDMEASAEANQNTGGTQYHWRKAHLRAFANAIRTTPPAPKPEPLTEQQIDRIRKCVCEDPDDLPEPWSFRQGVRATEAHYSITSTKGSK